jgi:hypothetical protein
VKPTELIKYKTSHRRFQLAEYAPHVTQWALGIAAAPDDVVELINDPKHSATGTVELYG